MEHKRVLLVEDNKSYQEAALECLSSRQLEVALARDYIEALEQLANPLANPDFGGVISDCFFPEETGSGKRDLGYDVVRKLQAADPVEKRIARGLEFFAPLVDLNDPEMMKFARNYAATIEINERTPVIGALKKVSMFGKGRTTSIAKYSLGAMYESGKSLHKDYYTAMRQAIENDEANAPLGILIAGIADELGLPVVLATSTHHHDILTQPIQDYSKGRWPLIDCEKGNENGKATPGYWKHVLDTLDARMK